LFEWPVESGNACQKHSGVFSSNLQYVFDVYVPQRASGQATGGESRSSVDEALARSTFMAEIFGLQPAPDTHVELNCKKPRKRGQPRFYGEKPIDLDTQRLNACLEQIKDCPGAIQVSVDVSYGA